MAANVISDLTGAPAAPASPAVAPSPEAKPVSPGNGLPEQANLILRGISTGQIPGALVTKDSPKIPNNLKPADFQALGVNLYRPRDKNFVAVAFSPKAVTESMLRKMDKDGTLADNFPTMTSLLAGPGGDAAGPVEGLIGDRGPALDTPVGGNSQVLPRPETGAIQAQAATKRVNSLSLAPSERAIPGAGSVLNGLLARAS